MLVSEKVGSSPSAKIIKSSSRPSKVESKKERSSVISNIPLEAVTSTVKINEIKSVSASIPDTVIPVTSYSTLNEFPSTSTVIVSAYTNANEIIVNRINPREIFNRELTLGKFTILSECNSSIVKLFITIC